MFTDDEFKFVRNLWSHASRFYAVIDNKDYVLYSSNFTDFTFSQNLGLTKLPVKNISAFYKNIRASWVNGTTLWLDYSFPAFPENIGHWMELLLPVFSELSTGKWKNQLKAHEDPYISNIIFPNMRRGQLSGVSWVVDLTKLALAPALKPGTDLPVILFYDELETMNATSWLGFERVLYIQDRYTHPLGRNGFSRPELAAQFRDAAYQYANFTRHSTWDKHVPPATITYIMSTSGEQVVNNPEVLAALRDLGSALGMKVRPYSITTQAHFNSYVAAMAKTGVLVARHGPVLGSTVFLPPGAMVLELLPYNWEWRGLSQIYLNLTRSMGDIHHFAWRAMSPQWAVYADPDDAKYSQWSIEECSSKYCLEAHARAGMVVDIATVQEILADLVPHVMKGEPVKSLSRRRPWPQLDFGDGHTGLWWDVQ